MLWEGGLMAVNCVMHRNLPDIFEKSLTIPIAFNFRFDRG